jgi:hypothetical protein
VLHNPFAPTGVSSSTEPEMKVPTLGIPERIIHPLVSEAPRRDTVLPQEFIDILTPGMQNPSVANLKRLILKNKTPILLTNFSNGSQGQEIKVLGDGVTSVSHGGRIFNNTGNSKLLAANKVYTFTLFGVNWYENA